MKRTAFLKTWMVYALLTFPMFYFVYKYGTPNFGLKDFYDYYKLYSTWDIEHVEAPFNMRLLSSFCVYLLNKSGLHYETATAFDQIGLDKQVFFNAVLFNFLCVVTTSVVIFSTIRKHFNNILLSFCGGVLYLLGFGTLFYELMPITDALSVLLFSIVVYHYLKKSYLVIIPLLLLIIQREYVFLALGLVTLLDYWKFREKYYLHILLSCVAFFGIYFLLRKTLFYTPKYDHQASPAYFLESIFTLKFPIGPYLKQTLMTLNVFILYLVIVTYKKIKHQKIDTFSLVKLLLLFLQINVISFAAVFGNNTGRYFYILVPLVIVFLIREVEPLLREENAGAGK